MEYEKHIKRLVLGYLKRECKNAYKVFLKYNFNNQNKHIPTRVAGQTLEDILRIYSRVEELVQGRLEDTDYYKERSVEFSSPIYLDEQLLYLLERDRPFTPSSTPCPRSPAESSVAESHHANEFVATNDVETTPEHTLPGNISSHDDYQSKTPFRKEASTTPCMEKLPTDKETLEVMTSKVSENTEFQKKLANNINITLNTPDIPCFSHRGENEKNKEGVGTELDDMLQHILGTPTVNTISKAVSVQSTTSASSSNLSQTTTQSRNWQPIDDHNNRAVSSILAAANAPNAIPSTVTTTNDNMTYSDNLNNFSDMPVSSALQIPSTPTSFTNNQLLIPTSLGMYIVPQPTTSAIQSGKQQQQFYIVNQPVVMPQPVMQYLQPIAPSANKPAIIRRNQKTPLRNDNTQLSEQDIMSMPTIILNERNEVTYADPGSFPTDASLKGNEAHNLKEYINLYGACDQSPILKLSAHKKGYRSQPRIKPTQTIKVEIFQHDAMSNNTANNLISVSSENNSQNQSSTNQVESTGLPNLNDIMQSESVESTHEEPTKQVDKEVSSVTTNKSKITSHDKAEARLVGGVCTPSPVKTTVKKPTPKSGSHVRNLSFPSPLRKTSEKPDSKRSSPRIINKQQATKDLFKSDIEEEKTDSKEEKQPIGTAKMPTRSSERNVKQTKKESSKTPKKVAGKDKTKSSKKTPKREGTKENAQKQIEEIVSKSSWDSNLRKLIPVIEENNSTPQRSSVTKKRVRRSSELDGAVSDGKKLEEALKTPKNEKPKHKTPRSKKNAKVSSDKKLEEKRTSPDNETKGETKILSPSKLNANKRNILLNEGDDTTPNIPQESSQYPITSKTRRNISSLLDTPIKDDFIPPTPGTVPDKSDTPFTPMLRANLKDFTEGDTFSINTPNFPITPGLATMVNTSAAYYILNDTESNKVTEATVLSEEKKSSVRKSDDEEVEFSPRVYGTSDILENFNKSCIGQKNLELLDNRGVTWDGSSDREEQDNSGNISEEESNNTVIQNQKVESVKGIKVLPRRSNRTSGKCMAKLQSQLLQEINKQPDQDQKLSGQKDLSTKLQGKENEEKDENTKDALEATKMIKSCSSGSESEVLSKKSYNTRRNSQTKTNMEDNVLENKGKDIDKNIKKSTGVKSNISTQEVRQTISEVCLGPNLGSKPAFVSMQDQLDEKKRRVMELQKAEQLLATRKTPRRATIKSRPNITPERNKRKIQNPKKVIQSMKSDQVPKTMEDTNEEHQKSTGGIQESVQKKQPLGKEGSEGAIAECHNVDSQDEFFKKSGTNLHRKNRGSISTTKEDDSRKELDDNNSKEHEDNRYGSQPENKLEKSHDNRRTSNKQKLLVEKSSDIVSVQEGSQNVSCQPNNPDEFEKSWEDCQTSLIEAEHEVIYHEESKKPDKKLEDYDFSLLNKKIILGVPCSDGSTVSVRLTVSSFETLLHIKPSDECEINDNRDELEESFELKLDGISDSENAESKTDNVDIKCAKKRKHRSDSCNSNSSTKRIKKNIIFNDTNIQKVLTQIHGPEPNEQKDV